MAKKRYKVIGTQPVNDTPPGEIFEADEEEVAFALEIGAVQAAPGRPPKQDDDED